MLRCALLVALAACALVAVAVAVAVDADSTGNNNNNGNGDGGVLLAAVGQDATATVTTAPNTTTTTTTTAAPAAHFKDMTQCLAHVGISAGLAALPAGGQTHIVVLDSAARLVAAARTDGAWVIADDFAEQKARVAALMRIPSGMSWSSTGVPEPNGIRFPWFDPARSGFNVDRRMYMAGLGGAFPVVRDGVFLGAVGVSGAPTAQGDIDVATPALAAMQAATTVCDAGAGAPAPEIAVDAARFPRLADAAKRIKAMQDAAVAAAQPEVFIVLDDVARQLAFSAMDNVAGIGRDLARLKARSALLLNFNSTKALYDSGVLQPGGALYTGDSSNGGLVSTPGGVLVRGSDGKQVVAAIGVSGAPTYEADVAIAAAGTTALGNAAFGPSAASCGPKRAYAVLQAALDKARALNASTKTTVVVAIADAAGELFALYSDGATVPGAVDQAIAKARSAVTLPFPSSVVEGLCAGPTPAQEANLASYSALYGLCGIGHRGVVFYSGVAALSLGGAVVGGVGVYTSSDDLSIDDQIAAAGAAAVGNELAPADFKPPRSSNAGLLDAAAASAACRGSLATLSDDDTCAVCAVRNARGELSVMHSNCERGSVGPAGIAVAVSKSSYLFSAKSDAFQSAVSVIDGKYATALNAYPQTDTLTLVPGATVLRDSTGNGIAGSIGFATTRKMSAAFTGNDAASVASALKLAASLAEAAGAAYTDSVSSRSCLSSTKSYWAGLAAGNFTRAFDFVADDVVFSWPGNPALLPMAGEHVGKSGIVDFFVAVGKVFDFTFCNNAGPTILATSDPAVVQAHWLECSPLRGTATVPCARNRNQALYTCDFDGKIRRVDVNLDNECVAQALCSKPGGLVCGRSSTTPSTPSPPPTSTQSGGVAPTTTAASGNGNGASNGGDGKKSGGGNDDDSGMTPGVAAAIAGAGALVLGLVIGWCLGTRSGQRGGGGGADYSDVQSLAEADRHVNSHDA